MAVYHDIPGVDVSFVAATDLTGLQYHFVKPGSVLGEVVVANGASNPAPFGILQNAPSPTQEARVRLLGPSKLFCLTGATCGIAYGRFVTVNASGQGIPIATEAGSPILARNIGDTMAVSASQFIEVFYFGAGLNACATSAS